MPTTRRKFTDDDIDQMPRPAPQQPTTTEDQPTTTQPEQTEDNAS